MLNLREQIVEKLQHIPESCLREVLDFVEFLGWRGATEEDPVLAVAGILSGEALSPEEIDRELYGDEGD